MTKRRIEIFTAGCPVCEETVRMVRRIACDSCEIEVRSLADRRVADRAQELGITSVPAVVIDGSLAECCRGAGVSEQALRAAGVGTLL